MELSGRYRIVATRETVWKNLNDAAVLEKCVPGVQSFEEGTDEAGQRKFDAAAKLKIGPVNALFKGSVTLENVNAPSGYRLRGEGKGGVAGFGRGFADVALTEVEDGAATVLFYTGEAQVGGKLASIGSRLVGGSVKKLAGEFFRDFAAAIGAEAHEWPDEEPRAGAAGTAAPAAPGQPIIGPAIVGKPIIGQPTVGKPTVAPPTVGRPSVGPPIFGKPADENTSERL